MGTRLKTGMFLTLIGCWGMKLLVTLGFPNSLIRNELLMEHILNHAITATKFQFGNLVIRWQLLR